MKNTRRYDAAGKFLVSRGFNSGDKIPAAEVQAMLASFHEMNLAEVEQQFAVWWNRNIVHAAQETNS